MTFGPMLHPSYSISVVVPAVVAKQLSPVFSHYHCFLIYFYTRIRFF